MSGRPGVHGLHALLPVVEVSQCALDCVAMNHQMREAAVLEMPLKQKAVIPEPVRMVSVDISF